MKKIAIVLGLLVILGISAISFLLIKNNSLKEEVAALESDKIVSGQEKEQVTGQKSPCDFTNNKVGCGRNDFKIISPNGGEGLCIGDEMIISWKAPTDAEAVTLRLSEDGLRGKQYNVGTFPASFNEDGKNNGAGTTVWKIPDNVEDSMAYKLWINMIYKGSSINDSSDNFFNIQNCQG